jgi:hypothetical protein
LQKKTAISKRPNSDEIITIIPKPGVSAADLMDDIGKMIGYDVIEDMYSIEVNAD